MRPAASIASPILGHVVPHRRGHEHRRGRPPELGEPGGGPPRASPAMWHRSQPFETNTRCPSTGSRAMSVYCAVNRNSIRFEKLLRSEPRPLHATVSHLDAHLGHVIPHRRGDLDESGARVDVAQIRTDGDRRCRVSDDIPRSPCSRTHSSQQPAASQVAPTVPTRRCRTGGARGRAFPAGPCRDGRSRSSVLADR